MAYNYPMIYRKIIERGEYNDFLTFALRMRKERFYSLYNSGLIYLQRPGAYIVHTETQWNHKGRTVRPEATPIVITIPFGPVEFVYELGDTEGAPYKGVDVDSIYDDMPKTLGEEHLGKLIDVLAQLGIRYSVTNRFGLIQNGEAELLDSPMQISVTKNKKTISVYTRYNILVKDNIPDSRKVCTILHEVGHILCGHIHYDSKDKNIITTPNRSGEELTYYNKECEAEEVCRIFCTLLGYKYDPTEYLEGHYKKGEDPSKASQFYILSAVHNLIHAWES